MKNKKGLSAIVATILIILLVVAGVTLMWNPIRKMISDSSDKIEGSCLLAEVTIVDGCYTIDDTGGDDADTLTVTVKNGPQEVIESLQIIYGTDADMTNSYTTSGVDAELAKNTEKAFTDSTLEITALAPTQVKVAPIVNGELCSSTEAEVITSPCT